MQTSSTKRPIQSATSAPQRRARRRLPMLFALALASGLGAQTATPPSAAPQAPLQGFVYVEPFEIRLEFVAHLATVASSPTATISTPARSDILAAARAGLRDVATLHADDTQLTFEPEELRFVRIDPELGPVPDDRPSIAASEAIVAAVFSHDRSAFPTQLALTWKSFPTVQDDSGDRSEVAVPVEFEAIAATGSANQRFELTAEQPTATWLVPTELAAPRQLAVSEIRTPDRMTPALVGGGFLVLGLVILAIGWRRKQRLAFAIAGLLGVVLGAGSIYNATQISAAAGVTATEARGIVEALLKNVYHAFAYRKETQIFDTLASSVDGPLLEDLYLDIRRGLNVEEDGGPRVKVLRVTVVSCELQRRGDGALHAGVIWVSEGNVGHWGHEHRRRNQYRGELRIGAHDNRWKLEDVEILSEERT